MPLQSTRSSLERRRDREAAMTALNLCISSAIVSLNCSSSSWEYHVLSVSALLSLRKRKSWLVVAKLTERVWVVIVDYYAFVLSVGVIAFGFCTTVQRVSRFEGRDIAKFGWIRFNKIRCSETTRAAAAEQSSKGNDSFGREPFMTPRREAFVAGFHGTFVWAGLGSREG